MSSAEEPRASDGLLSFGGDLQTPAPGLPEPGDLIAEKYRVERVVGVGGMGVVVAAVHVQLEERVALKLMKREVMSPDTIARFLREARSAAKIKSEHVARVNDVGVLPGGTPYMVMELLEGEDLGQRVRDRGPLPYVEAVDYVLQACEAVGEAHALGIVHRDLKPSNLFLARRAGGRRIVKVVDFGISKQLATGAPEGGMPALEEAAKTRTSAWLGSPLYMSPEQMRSAKDVDARADIWSLGLILYELCSGHVPFDAPSLAELCAHVLHEPPTPLERWVTNPPPALLRAIEGCLKKKREERYQDVADLALALDVLATASGSADRVQRVVSIARRSGEGRSDRPPPPSEEDAAPMPLVRPQTPEYEVLVRTTTHDEDKRPPPKAAPARARTPVAPVDRSRGRGRLAALLALLLCAVGGAVVYVQRGAVAATPAKPVAPPVPPPSSTARELVAESAAPVVSPREVPVATVAPVPSASAVVEAPVASATGRDGSKRAPVAAGVRTAAVAPPPPPPGTISGPGQGPGSIAPLGVQPPRPEVLSEDCAVTLPDGTRKPIPCR